MFFMTKRKSKNNGVTSSENYIQSSNGNLIYIFTDKGEEFVKVASIARALGYSGFNCDGSILGMVFKNHQFKLYTKLINGGLAYMIKLDQVIPVLNAFIKLTLTVKNNNSERYAQVQNDARMSAQQLIEIFNREVFHENNCNLNLEIELTSFKEDIQMESKGEESISVFTIKDIQDIGERAAAIIKVYGFSAKDALRATTLLKAQEIKRDLSPLVELLK